MKSCVEITIVIVIVIMIMYVAHAKAIGNTNHESLYDRPDLPRVYTFANSNLDSRTLTIGLLGGVHGNEPAGSMALQELIENGWFARTSQRTGIGFIVIPRANEHGLAHNTRWTHSLQHPDLNRSFTEPLDRVAAHIINALAGADLVVDFHEGWGWHVKTPSSIGSSLSPTRVTPHVISARVAHALNSRIADSDKRFVVLDEISCDIRSALSCYMERLGRQYILMETTGQKNIQPMRLRVNQIHTAIQVIVDMFKNSHSMP